MDYIAPPSTLPPGSLVWCYMRDSGGTNQEQSITQQRDEITAYCQLHGLVLERVYADAAKSGGTTKGRDQFSAMIDAAMNTTQRPAGLLVWSFSRFSRDVDDSAFYKAMLRRMGIAIHSLTEPIPAGLAGHIIESVQDFSNADYRQQMAKQIKRAQEINVKDGYAHGGFPPVGYLAEKVVIGTHRDGRPRIVSRWIPDLDKFNLVKLAWKMRAAGKPYAEIIKATEGKLYQTRNSWATFFANRTYLGVYKYGALEIPNHHEAAITLEDWDKVQAIRREKSSRLRGLTHPRRVRYPSLLSGLSYCIHCGAAMVHHNGNGKSKFHFYYCGTRDRRRGKLACDARRVNAREADVQVFDAILSRILTPGYVEELLDAMKAELSDTATLADEIKRKKQTMYEISRAINNLLDLAETFGAGAARDRLKERETSKAVLETEIKMLEARKQDAEIVITPDALAVVLDAWRAELIETKERGDVGALRSFIARFVTKIELGYNVAKIWYNYPMGIHPIVSALFEGTPHR